MGKRLEPRALFSLSFSKKISSLVILVFGVLFQGCGIQNLTPLSNSSGAGLSAGPEPANCVPRAPVTNPIAVTGHADYYYRPTNIAGLSSTQGLYGDPVSAFIRYAEVAVYDSSGSVIQCGSTDSSGNFSVQIPKVNGSYSVGVLSRSPTGSAAVNASVLEDIYASAPYQITASFTVATASVSAAVGTLVAYARVSESAKVVGGAFFIFDNILYANERIRTLIGDASFVAPKVQAYWKAGFNPYSYFGYPSSLASFYVNGDRKLYILGGNNGDVKNTDTDHFDAAVIVHEYSHFLEDVYGRSESPGGSHNGNGIIDPRLAWSEGWANYLQAQLENGRYYAPGYYVDTIGFRGDSVEGSGASAGLGFKVNLSEDGGTASYDRVSVAGEGTFRELSISRTLFKTTKSPASNVSGSRAAAIPFLNLWNAFTSTVSGFGTSSATVFRSIGFFNEYMGAVLGGVDLTNWSTNVLADEKQNPNRKDFADAVTKSGVACGTRDIIPVADGYDSAGYAHSNWLLSNDFYSFYYSGVGSQVIKLNYSEVGTQNIDLDLILWNTGFRYIDDDQQRSGISAASYISASSRRAYPAAEVGTEQISLSGLSPGYYLIDVKALTFNRSTLVPLTTAELNGTARYSLQLITNGTTTEYLCPAH